MAQPTTTATNNPPKLTTTAIDFDVAKQGRNYGILLGALMSVYMLIVNQLYAELPMGVRFAKHLLIIPVVWYATKSYADAIVRGNHIFKAEIGLMFRIGLWATLVIAVLNITLSAIDPQLGFEQFLNDNNSFADAMMNSFFVAMETLVFVVIIGFVFMQYYKTGSAPEDS
jgi:hypothetical protein